MDARDTYSTEQAGEDGVSRDERERRRGFVAVLVLVAALAIVVWLILRYADLGTAPDVPDTAGVPSVQRVRVPDVVGLTAREAERVLAGAGLAADIEVSYDADAVPGTVVAQDPPAGERTAVGSNVLLTVASELSVAPPRPEGWESQPRVPNVVGKREEDARSLLRASGYRVTVSEVFSASAPEGSVVDQYPSGGSAAAAGTEVGIVVSKGRTRQATYEVPAVVGLASGDAAMRVREAGLEPRLLYQPNPSMAGRVYQQSPQPGTRVARDRYVFLLVGVRP